MKSHLSLLLVLHASIMLSAPGSYSQGVSINSNGTAADTSAILDVNSSTKGVLFPRLTTTQRNAIASPAEGLLIYNTTTKCVEMYISGFWSTLSCPSTCLAPTTPSLHGPSNIVNLGFTAGWDASTNTAATYYLDVSTSHSFSSYVSGYNNLNVGTALSKNVTLSAPGKYYYRVKASNSCGTSNYSATDSITLTYPYITITLTNNYLYDTEMYLPQRIVVNSSLYSAYEMSGLENVVFSTDRGGAGTILKAWVESGASSASTNTVWWVNLDNGTIGANGGTLTIYMNFMLTNYMSQSGPTGKAPQLTGTYGQYDNGAQVFSTYDNFAGTSLSSMWIAGNGSHGSYSVNNGLTVTSNGSTQTVVQSANSIIGQQYVVEVYASNTMSGFNLGLGIVENTQTANTNGYFNFFSNQSMNSYIRNGTTWTPDLANYATYTYSTFNIIGIGRHSEIAYPTFNYSTFQWNWSAVDLFNNYYVIMNRPWLDNTADAGTNVYQWFRVRIEPPYAAMPSVSLGSIAFN